MAAVITRHVAAAPSRAWEVVSDLRAHAGLVPLTRILPEPGREPQPGWRFIARTQVGSRVLDDRMRMTTWQPPGDDGVGTFHADKVGPHLLGWARLDVRPGPRAGTCVVTWSEHIRLRVPLPRPVTWLIDAATHWMFARVLDALLRRSSIDTEC